ncbi:MAG: hypothetical protein L3J75_01795 [Methylococcaceae bacterium]|nr:hypothetical protein [Methylococcaceae bacterium]
MDIYLPVLAGVFTQIDVLPVAGTSQIAGDLFLAFLFRVFCLKEVDGIYKQLTTTALLTIIH